MVEILETEGYDAVQLREVARRARMSLATIYKRYATRDELILAALDTWMQQSRYSGIAPHAREPGRIDLCGADELVPQQLQALGAASGDADGVRAGTVVPRR